MKITIDNRVITRLLLMESNIQNVIENAIINDALKGNKVDLDALKFYLQEFMNTTIEEIRKLQDGG